MVKPLHHKLLKAGVYRGLDRKARIAALELDAAGLEIQQILSRKQALDIEFAQIMQYGIWARRRNRGVTFPRRWFLKAYRPGHDQISQQ